MNHTSNRDWQRSLASSSANSPADSAVGPATAEHAVGAAVGTMALPSDHLGQLLQRLAADFQQRTLIKCHQRGHHRIRGSHFTIASYLDQTGQSLGELALRIGITQQATGKLLRDLEFGGYACSAVDDQDKRSRIIRLTGAGVALQADLAAILQEIRGEYSARIGASGLQALEGQLQQAVAALVQPTTDLAGDDGTDSVD